MWRQNMKEFTTQKNCILALVVGLTVAFTSPVLAEKGGKVKGGKHEQKEKHHNHKGSNNNYSQDRNRSNVNVSINFGDQHRNVIRNYYTEQYHSGHCPPGLAKKNNRCLPPGQARKWQVGRPLPRDVIFYDLPPAVVVQLGPPPAGHRFVRVASDILMIAVGSGMIVDAIQDLSQN